MVQLIRQDIPAAAVTFKQWHGEWVNWPGKRTKRKRRSVGGPRMLRWSLVDLECSAWATFLAGIEAAYRESVGKNTACVPQLRENGLEGQGKQYWSLVIWKRIL